VSRLALASTAVVVAACSLASFDSYSNGGEQPDAGAGPADASTDDGTSTGDSGPANLVSGASCAAIKEANPSAPDGRYHIVPVNGAVPAFDADCDMTQDGGGWMRVTEDMIAEEKKQSVTVVHEKDEKGGFLIRVFANSPGCGASIPADDYVGIIRDAPTWTRLRARYDFYGQSSCWDILGSAVDGVVFPSNMIQFDKTVDVVRDMVKMGGSRGDAFDGDPGRCDNETDNFWNQDVALGRRSLTAVLRRASPNVPAGLGTETSCTQEGPGVMSPTYWEYREIFVR
jgi:hypothetical protein